MSIKKAFAIVAASAVAVTSLALSSNVQAAEPTLKQQFFAEFNKALTDNVKVDGLAKVGMAYEFNTTTGLVNLYYDGDTTLKVTDFLKNVSGTGAIDALNAAITGNASNKTEIQSITLNNQEADRTKLTALQGVPGGLKAALGAEIANKINPTNKPGLTIAEAIDTPAMLDIKVSAKGTPDKTEAVQFGYVLKDFKAMKAEAIKEVKSLDRLSDKGKKAFEDQLNALTVGEFAKIGQITTKAAQDNKKIMDNEDDTTGSMDNKGTQVDPGKTDNNADNKSDNKADSKTGEVADQKTGEQTKPAKDNKANTPAMGSIIGLAVATLAGAVFAAVKLFKK